MPTYTRQPHPALRRYVASIVGYDYRLDPAAVHHGLPSTTATVVIAFDEPLDCGWFDTPAQRRPFWTLIGGLHVRPSLIRTHGHQVGLQLGLTPSGLRWLTGLPAAESSGLLFDHNDLALLAPGLHETLQSLGWRDRFALLEADLLRRLPAQPVAFSNELAHAWRQLTAPYPPSVTALAGELGWSRRHLLTRFRHAYGPSPSTVARLARFERARHAVAHGLPLARVAAECGYFDQAHLNREWREFAAATPTQTVQDFPSVQAPMP